VVDGSCTACTGKVGIGLGRIVALCYRSATPYQVH
jgi:hypothetical protein